MCCPFIRLLFYGLLSCLNGVSVVVKWLLWIVKRIFTFMMCKSIFRATPDESFLAARKNCICGIFVVHYLFGVSPLVLTFHPFSFFLSHFIFCPTSLFCSSQATRKACVGVKSHLFAWPCHLPPSIAELSSCFIPDCSLFSEALSAPCLRRWRTARRSLLMPALQLQPWTPAALPPPLPHPRHHSRKRRRKVGDGRLGDWSCHDLILWKS